MNLIVTTHFRHVDIEKTLMVDRRDSSNIEIHKHMSSKRLGAIAGSSTILVGLSSKYYKTHLYEDH